jgi:transposase
LALRWEERGPTRAAWRCHIEVWRLSGLTQRDYCEQHGLSLKSFGNWKAQLKREDAVGSDARWGRYPRLRPSSRPGSKPRPKAAPSRKARPATPAEPAPSHIIAERTRRRFSEEAKRRIVEEASRPGASVTSVAKRYKITTSLLFRWRQALGPEPVATTTFLPVRIADVDEPAAAPGVADRPPARIIVERASAGIEIELIGGRRVRFERDVDAETMRRVVTALEADRS